MSGKRFPSYEHTMSVRGWVIVLGIRISMLSLLSYLHSTIMCNINPSKKYRKFSSKVSTITVNSRNCHHHSFFHCHHVIIHLNQGSHVFERYAARRGFASLSGGYTLR